MSIQGERKPHRRLQFFYNGRHVLNGGKIVENHRELILRQPPHCLRGTQDPLDPGCLDTHEHIAICLALTLCQHPEMFQLHHEQRDGSTGLCCTPYRLFEECHE